MTSVLHRLRIALWRLAYSVRGEQGLGQEPFSPPWLMQPHLSQVQRDLLVGTGDPIRYGTLLLAFEQVAKDQIPGSLAECGYFPETSVGLEDERFASVRFPSQEHHLVIRSKVSKFS